MHILHLNVPSCISCNRSYRRVYLAVEHNAMFILQLIIQSCESCRLIIPICISCSCHTVMNIIRSCYLKIERTVMHILSLIISLCISCSFCHAVMYILQFLPYSYVYIAVYSTELYFFSIIVQQ